MKYPMHKLNQFTGEWEDVGDTELIIDHINLVKRKLDSIINWSRVIFFQLSFVIGLIIGHQL
jgi:hypothetical protein